MTFDKALTISDDQDLSQVAGSYLSTTTVDLGAEPPVQLGDGAPVVFAFVVTEAFASGGAATLNIELVEDTAADLSSSPATIIETGVIALADLAKGAVFTLTLPPGKVLTDRYIGARYVIGTATTTAGTITAGIVGNAPMGNRAGFTAETGWS